MVFKDQARALLARWQNLRSDSELSDLAVQTVVVLASEDDIPAYVLDALDGLMLDYEQRTRRIVDIVRYLQYLAEDRTLRTAVSEKGREKGQEAS